MNNSFYKVLDNFYYSDKRLLDDEIDYISLKNGKKTLGNCVIVLNESFGENNIVNNEIFNFSSKISKYKNQKNIQKNKNVVLYLELDFNFSSKNVEKICSYVKTLIKNFNFLTILTYEKGENDKTPRSIIHLLSAIHRYLNINLSFSNSFTNILNILGEKSIFSNYHRFLQNSDTKKVYLKQIIVIFKNKIRKKFKLEFYQFISYKNVYERVNISWIDYYCDNYYLIWSFNDQELNNDYYFRIVEEQDLDVEKKISNFSIKNNEFITNSNLRNNIFIKKEINLSQSGENTLAGLFIPSNQLNKGVNRFSEIDFSILTEKIKVDLIISNETEQLTEKRNDLEIFIDIFHSENALFPKQLDVTPKEKLFLTIKPLKFPEKLIRLALKFFNNQRDCLNFLKKISKETITPNRKLIDYDIKILDFEKVDIKKASLIRIPKIEISTKKNVNKNKIKFKLKKLHNSEIGKKEVKYKPLHWKSIKIKNKKSNFFDISGNIDLKNSDIKKWLLPNNFVKQNKEENLSHKDVILDKNLFLKDISIRTLEKSGFFLENIIDDIYALNENQVSILLKLCPKEDEIKKILSKEEVLNFVKYFEKVNFSIQNKFDEKKNDKYSINNIESLSKIEKFTLISYLLNDTLSWIQTIQNFRKNYDIIEKNLKSFVSLYDNITNNFSIKLALSMILKIGQIINEDYDIIAFDLDNIEQIINYEGKNGKKLIDILADNLKKIYDDILSDKNIEKTKLETNFYQFLDSNSGVLDFEVKSFLFEELTVKGPLNMFKEIIKNSTLLKEDLGAYLAPINTDIQCFNNNFDKSVIQSYKKNFYIFLSHFYEDLNKLQELLNDVKQKESEVLRKLGTENPKNIEKLVDFLLLLENKMKEVYQYKI